MPPQPLCLAILPVNPKASSPFPCPRLSFPSARHLPLVLPKGSRKATIPFRIIFFADTHHLTPMESYSYKNRGRGWGHSLPLNAFLSDQRLVSRASGVRDLSARPTRKSVLTSEARKDLSPNPTKDFCPERRTEAGEVLLGRFCQLQCLQIRSHDVGDPADLGGGSDLVGRLRCEIVKPERGEQADDSLGDLVSRLNEGGVLGAN